MQQVLHVEGTQVHQALGSLLTCRGDRGHSVLLLVSTSPRLSALYLLTGAVQAARQLGGHHLHDEADPEPQHVAKQGRLGAHVHGQIHHDLLREQRDHGETGVRGRRDGGGGSPGDLPE